MIANNFNPRLILLALAATAGCASPNAQVKRIQAEKDKLLVTIDQQREANRSLQTSVASLEKRLDQAETQLASGTSRGSMPAVSQATKPARPQAAKEDTLPWRPHRAASQPKVALPAIAQLARQDDRIEVDAETGAGVWAEDITFEPKTSALTPESRQQLAELAKLLQRSPASKFRVLVATSAERTGSRTREAAAKSGRQLATSRAQSVADYLDRHGIAEDRLAISSTGVRKNTQSEHGLPATGADEVRVYLVDPDQPVLGWLTPETIRR